MKLNKELIKQGFKNQFITILHMIIFNIISFIIFWASNIGTISTGNTDGRGFLPLAEYKCNLFLVIICWILFLTLFSIFYTKFFKRDLKKQIELHWIFVIIFLIVSVIFCLIEFIILVITQIYTTGIFSTIVNYPDSIFVLVSVYIMGYIVMDFIREKMNKKKIKKLK